jgi:hypothetical protein
MGLAHLTILKNRTFFFYLPYFSTTIGRNFFPKQNILNIQISVGSKFAGIIKTKKYNEAVQQFGF